MIDHVCRLIRSIYGLKQSARVWYETLSQILRELHFEPCTVDPCLFRRKETDDSYTFLIMHVDDILGAGKRKHTLDKLREDLNKRFSITDLGELKCYLGINV